MCMLRNISWTVYWSFILFLLVCYYGVLLYRMYGHRIVRSSNSLPERKEEIKKSEQPASISRDDDSMAEEVQAYFDQAAHQKPAKEELLYAMQRLYAKQRRVIEDSEKMAIAGLIQLESKEKCAVSLSNEEVGLVWLA